VVMGNRCFESFDDQGLIILGVVATQCGTRPSQLVEWTEPEDWYARLVFDIRAIAASNKAQNDKTRQGGGSEWPITRR